MDLTNVSNSELLEKLTGLRGSERKVTLAILYYLIELDKRKLFVEQGYSSLYYYCVRKLGYSESSAYRRITGARCIRDNPELADMFLQGKVTLCSIATAAPVLKMGTAPEELVGKSKREVELMVSGQLPVSPKKEIIKPITIEAPKDQLLTAPSPVEVKYEIRFTVSKEVYKQFEEAKAKLSNSVENLTVEAVFSKLIQNYLNPNVKKSNTTNPNSRNIPRSVKREVYLRDKGTCTYESPDGTQCCETKYLQIDHIQPYAIGGRTEASNLRLLCSAHNRMQSEKSFGKFNTPPVKSNLDNLKRRTSH